MKHHQPHFHVWGWTPLQSHRLQLGQRKAARSTVSNGNGRGIWCRQTSLTGAGRQPQQWDLSCKISLGSFHKSQMARNTAVWITAFAIWLPKQKYKANHGSSLIYLFLFLPKLQVKKTLFLSQMKHFGFFCCNSETCCWSVTCHWIPPTGGNRCVWDTHQKEKWRDQIHPVREPGNRAEIRSCLSWGTTFTAWNWEEL